MPAFGRLYKPDKRDVGFPMSSLLVGASTRTSRLWDDTIWVGNQGNKPHCVGYGWAHWLEAAPVFQGPPHPAVNPDYVYFEAQKVDEWPGIDYAGTSVRGGAKVLKSMGYIKAYYWANNLTDVVNTVLDRGPVVVGTSWYVGMSNPDKAGLMRVKGKLEGGHCYLITGVDRIKQWFRIRNSWGTTWGLGGRAYISFKDFARLLSMDGEACLATEIKVTHK